MVRLRQLSSKYYRELFESASEAIWIHDLEGKVVAANKAAENLSGYSRGKQHRPRVTQFLGKEALARAREIRRRLLKGEAVERRYEQRIIKRDGTEAILEMVTSVVHVDGKPVAFQHIARDVTEERRMRDSLRFYLQAVIMAQEDERKRLARELHDDTIQSLLLLTRRLDVLISADHQRKLSRPARDELEELHALAVDTCEGLWRYTRNLRPRILDDMGLTATLEYMAGELRDSDGINVSIHVSEGMPDLPAEVQLVMFRIAQEALNNIKDHAGASRVAVRLKCEKDKVTMTIRDNGRGFEVPKQIGDFAASGRLGLLGMYERARLLNGTLEVKSVGGKGTKLRVQIPVRQH
jgi:two-component system sensor histidine kinase DegS